MNMPAPEWALDAATDWTPVCRLDEILPDTGVCARVQGRHVAVFRVGADRLYPSTTSTPSPAPACCRAA